MNYLVLLLFFVLNISPVLAQVTLGTSGSSTNPQRSGDATTGLFSSSPGVVSINTAGTEMLRVSGAGVGIGTSMPGSSLSVHGTADFVAGSISMSTANDSGAIYNFENIQSGSSTGGVSLNVLEQQRSCSRKFWFLRLLKFKRRWHWVHLLQLIVSIIFRYAPGGVTSYDFLEMNPANHTSGFTGTVGIGTTSPTVSLDMSQEIDAIALPSGTTAQRPTPTNGEIRYNKSLSAVEAYVGGTWVSFTNSATALAIGSSGRLLCGGLSCSNSSGSTAIGYCSYKGNVKTTATYGSYIIPSGCLNAVLTSMYVGGTAGQAAAASTLYYVYLINVSGITYLDLETTGHTTDAATGVEVETGDNTKTLVGMIHTNSFAKIMSAGQTHTVGDTNTIATWDNRQPTTTRCAFTTTRQITSATLIEVNSENRCYFMSWQDAAQFSSQLIAYPAAEALIETVISLDGTTTYASIN